MEVPAPWSLTGRAFILMYRFPEEFIRTSCFLPDEWKDLKWSGLGYVMIVDYQESPVGPYKELLIIPGKAHFGDNRLGTISKIYVDSIDSMNNGRANWGIPKELTDFKWSEEGKEHTIEMGSFGPWMIVTIEPGSVPFPIDTRFMPINLYQEYEGKTFRMNLKGKGTGHFSLVKDFQVDPLFFPDLNKIEPIVSIYVDPFRLTFPEPDRTPLNR